MPQLDISSFPPQLFWLAISFVLLYVVMSRLALPRVGEILRIREERITSDLDRAERLNRDAEDAVKAYEQALAEARAKATDIATKTRAAVQAEAEARQAEAEARLTAQLEAAEARIRATRDEAMSHVREIASDTAVALVTRLLGSAPESARLDQAVGEELQRRGAK
ncbi:F0F1 ATP synthase subunit B' [Iodidimonas sp. SYSU 1G8]|uniref:F0F1 ATP synthase subunit B family protein n=1 Tax=Iodidimonas sp. SYSU 1G8 TaxID=3133967 RepID=UPI0031FF1DFE